ncbi:MAG: GldM family protein [Agriterribacter sp.]
MKKIFFTALIFFSGKSILYAQVDVINTILIVPDSNTVFIGVENIFEIVHAAKGEYILKAISSQIQRSEKLNSFIVKPHALGVDTFCVLKEGRTIYSKAFTVSYLPPPIAILGAIEKNIVPKEQVIAGRGLFVKKHNCTCLENWVVRSYTLKIQSRNIKEEDAIIYINGNLLPDKVIVIIQSLSKNDVITFDDIKAVGPTGRIVTLRPISITIQ